MFNQKTHRKFNYKPRFQGSKTDNYTEVSKADLERRWNEMRGQAPRKSTKIFSMPALILMLIGLFVLMYVLNGYMK